MSAHQSKPFMRRALASKRIADRINRALGPFAPDEILSFHPEKGLSTLRATPSKDGRLRIESARQPGFFESLYTKEIPRSLQRRFWLLDEGEPAPTVHQYRVLENTILGYARRKLRRELVARINKLPKIGSRPIPRGQKGGRLRDYDSDEYKRVRAEVKQLMETGNYGEGMSKREAIRKVAEGPRGISERHIWRIVLGH